MDLRVLSERLSVCRLPVDAPWPVPVAGTSFYSTTRTGSEVSVVCSEDADDLKAFRDRAKEPTLRFEDLVRDMKRRGKL